MQSIGYMVSGVDQYIGTILEGTGIPTTISCSKPKADGKTPPLISVWELMRTVLSSMKVLWAIPVSFKNGVKDLDQLHEKKAGCGSDHHYLKGNLS